MTSFAMARYLPNGSLDPTFGNGGKAIFEWAGGSRFRITDFDLSIGANNEIAVCGLWNRNTIGIALISNSGRMASKFGGGEAKSASVFMEVAEAPFDLMCS